MVSALIVTTIASSFRTQHVCGHARQVKATATLGQQGYAASSRQMAPVDFPLNLLFGYRSHAQENAEAMKDEADPPA